MACLLRAADPGCLILDPEPKNLEQDIPAHPVAVMHRPVYSSTSWEAKEDAIPSH